MTATDRKRKGTYLLFLVLRRSLRSSIGALGEQDVAAGEYCYVGSAMNGLDNRLERHFRIEKTARWHIDRLTVYADGMEAYISTEPIPECTLSSMAESCGCTPAIEGFGCSDCRCGTHLFLVDADAKQKLLNMTGMTQFPQKRI
jgi:Uri superfamily endonuclease